MKWNQPRCKKIEPEVLGNVTFFKPLNFHRKRGPINEKFVEPMAMKNPTQNELDKLKDILNNVNPDIPMACFLSSPSGSENMLKAKSGITVPHTSLLGHQYINQLTEPELEALPMSLPCLEDPTADKMKKIFGSKPKIISCRFDGFTILDSYVLEKSTRLQADSKLWHEARKFRITASNFGPACKRQKLNDKFEEQLKNKKDISHLPHVAIGIREESTARDIYLGQHPEITYFSCGLIINPLAPFLGASPDGIIFDDQKASFGVLEIKCKSGRKYTCLDEALKVKNFCLFRDENNKIQLKTDDPYNYQVQGQMLISCLSWGDLVIYFVHSKEIVKLRIYFDVEFCNNMYSKLYYIYNMYYNTD